MVTAAVVHSCRCCCHETPQAGQPGRRWQMWCTFALGRFWPQHQPLHALNQKCTMGVTLQSSRLVACKACSIMDVMHNVQKALQRFSSCSMWCTMHCCAGFGWLFPMLVAAGGRRSRHCASRYQCLPPAAPSVQGVQPATEAVNHHCSRSPVPPRSVQSCMFSVLCPHCLGVLEAQGAHMLLCSVCMHGAGFALVCTTFRV